MEKVLWGIGLLANIMAFFLLAVAVADTHRFRAEDILIVTASLLYILLNTYFVCCARPGTLTDTLLGIWIEAKKAELRRKMNA